ncbi:MAG: TonB-dependent receptor [Ichthyobacteriaceae bacterium]|nr:TonB-dependent receptor [Ichthyobacteriaceae bacterium]
MKRIYILLLLIIFPFISIFAQDGKIKGIFINSEGEPVQGVEVFLEGESVKYLSDDEGKFIVDELVNGKKTLKFFKDNYINKKIKVDVLNGNEVNIGDVTLVNGKSDKKDKPKNNDDLSNEDLIEETDPGNVSAFTNTSQDLLSQIAGIAWRNARFRIRGYTFDELDFYMNGIKMNDPATGWVSTQRWSGLNDVTRSNVVETNIQPHDYAFGGLGGASNIELRPSNMKKSVKASYSLSNQTYNNRVMATYSTGKTSNGWSFSGSMSKRWGDEGYINGTTFNGFAYYAGIEKEFNTSHSVALMLIGSQTRRGMANGSVDEINNLTDENQFNTWWGWQNGKKRSARVSHIHQPSLMFSHYFDINKNTKLTTNMSYMWGRGGRGTSINWWRGLDPRPNHYSYLPSWNLSLNHFFVGDQKAEAWHDESNTSYRQINWNKFYGANIDQAPDSTGMRRAHFVQDDARLDKNQFDFSTYLNTNINDNLSVSGGLSYTSYKSHNYRQIVDLLGAEYWLDIDNFVERDKPLTDATQVDLQNPNRKVKEGDIYSYNYNMFVSNVTGWGHIKYSDTRIELYGGLRVNGEKFWREGLFENGNNPGNLSYGDSDKLSYLTYGVKGGARYKITKQHHIYANSAYFTRAPYTWEVFVSPRTRNQIVGRLDNQDFKPETVKKMSFDINYQYKSENVVATLSAYQSAVNDKNRILSFYHDGLYTTDGREVAGIVNYSMYGIGMTMAGLEFAGEFKLSPSWSINTAIAYGNYIYNNEYDVDVTLDLYPRTLQSTQTSYMKGLKLEATPQKAAYFGINYRSPKQFWFSVNTSLFKESYVISNPVRRTEDSVYGTEFEGEMYGKIVDQVELDGAAIVNATIGKAWVIAKSYVSINLSINNVLDKKDFQTGGYEQMRFDSDTKNPDDFPPRFYYMWGRNFFLDIRFSL